MSTPSESDQTSVIDIDAALAYAAGDREMLLSVAQLFLEEEGPKQLAAIEACVRAGDGPGIRRAVHQLKGSVVIFGAEKAVAAAVDLESAAVQDDLTRAASAWNALSREMRTLFREVEKLCRE